MSKNQRTKSVAAKTAKQPPASAALTSLQRTFDAGDYVQVRQLAQKLKSSDPSHAALAQSWTERTQNDPLGVWLAFPIALLIVAATLLTAG